MPVPSTMADLSQLAASNSPAGTEAIGNSLDNYLRAQASILRSTNALSSATIAAASTTDLATSDAEHVQVTGSATITSLGTGFNGCYREVRFTGACTLAQSANLLLINGVNAVTQANDVAGFRCIGSGQWIMTSWSRPAAGSLGYVLRNGDTMPGALTAAGLTSSTGGFTGTAAAVLQSGIASGDVYLRPNTASATGELRINAAGDAIVSGSVIAPTVTATTFNTSAASAVLANNGTAGNVYLRPNGSGSVSGEFRVSSAGDAVISGSAVVTGSVSSSTVSSPGAFLVLANNGGAGSVNIRPNGSGSATGETFIQNSGNMTVNGSVTSTALIPGGGRQLTKITLSNAAPGALANGELYLQY